MLLPAGGIGLTHQPVNRAFMMQDGITPPTQPAKRRLVAGIGKIHPVNMAGGASLFMRHHINDRCRQNHHRQRQPGARGTQTFIQQGGRMRPQPRAARLCAAGLCQPVDK
ncbi:MAG: Uncharacterised protein [SAR116 cluster bacterium]|nr:MAG: Uncharacterised protein [SAR116 cluster bacterium]